MRFGLVGAVALAACVWLTPFAVQAGDLEGVVRTALPGVRMANAGPLVVYLESRDDGQTKQGSARIHQRYARFEPGFLVVAVGQTVVMSNDDTIYHNVFSYSRPNAFDLGLYPAGEIREIAFEHAGVVRTYCSIHENMNGTIFVAPTPYFARVDAGGRFRIEDVPAGRWTLRTWAERLPPWNGAVSVTEDASTKIDIVLGGARVPVPAAPGD